MMAVAHPPKLLLLDEHTAALDPVSAKKILKITNDIIERDHITALMITHNLRDALENGNRLLIFQDGKIKHDFSGEEKARLTLEDLIQPLRYLRLRLGSFFHLVRVRSASIFVLKRTASPFWMAVRFK